MKGYQFLKMDFFELCKARKVHRLPMLLYIYLRGLYCRFQKPIFTWEDSKITDHLGISQPTLQKCRKILSEKGLLLYKSGSGVKHPTEYTLIGNVLLPELKVKEFLSKGARNFHLPLQKLSPSIYTSKERLKNRIGNPEQEKKEKEEAKITLQKLGLRLKSVEF